jgi:hypothetical protein
MPEAFEPVTDFAFSAQTSIEPVQRFSRIVAAMPLVPPGIIAQWFVTAIASLVRSARPRRQSRCSAPCSDLPAAGRFHSELLPAEITFDAGPAFDLSLANRAIEAAGLGFRVLLPSRHVPHAAFRGIRIVALSMFRWSSAEYAPPTARFSSPEVCHDQADPLPGIVDRLGIR